MVGPNVLGRDGHRSDHRLFAHVHASQYRSVIRDAHPIIQPRQRIGHVALVHDAVGVAVDVGVIADRDVVTEGDSAPVVQEDVSVNDHVVAHLHVVPEGELDVLECFEVLAAPLENVGRQKPSQLDAELYVLTPGHGAIE